MNRVRAVAPEERRGGSCGRARAGARPPSADHRHLKDEETVTADGAGRCRRSCRLPPSAKQWSAVSARSRTGTICETIFGTRQHATPRDASGSLLRPNRSRPVAQCGVARWYGTARGVRVGLQTSRKTASRVNTACCEELVSETLRRNKTVRSPAWLDGVQFCPRARPKAARSELRSRFASTSGPPPWTDYSFVHRARPKAARSELRSRFASTSRATPLDGLQFCPRARPKAARSELRSRCASTSGPPRGFRREIGYWATSRLRRRVRGQGSGACSRSPRNFPNRW